MRTKAWTLFVALTFVTLTIGCAAKPRKPHWEIAIAIQVDNQINPQIKTTGKVEFKRPIPK